MLAWWSRIKSGELRELGSLIEVQQLKGVKSVSSCYLPVLLLHSCYCVLMCAVNCHCSVLNVPELTMPRQAFHTCPTLTPMPPPHTLSSCTNALLYRSELVAHLASGTLPMLVAIRGRVGSNEAKSCELSDKMAVIHEVCCGGLQWQGAVAG